MEKWEQQLIDNFGSAVVNKKLVLENEIQGIPRYVSEYILGAYAIDGITKESIVEANNFINSNKYSSREKELLKNKLISEYTIKVLDKFKAEVDTKKNKIKASMGTTQLANMIANPTLVKEHERLLIDGIWGLGELRYYSPGSEYDGEDVNKEGIIELQKFKPLQLSNISLEDFKKGRSKIDTESWINALISTVGLDYNNYDLRKKIIILSRMVPMVEESVFLMEFGKPGTGKTYCFENISAYSRVISGSAITPAQLFYNLQSKTPGLLLQYDIVLFDEIDKVRKKGLNEEVINKLYKYLESFSFDRGGVEQSSTCGIMMVGNISPDKEFEEETLFLDVLNEKLREEAFLTRLCGVIPGWELNPIEKREISLTKHYGFMADYFSEILHELRESYIHQNIAKERVKLINANIRDENSVMKIVSGLLKIIYPHGEIEDEYLDEIVKYAVEIRQFVIDQNYYITGKKDYDVKLEWEIKDEI